MSYREQYDFWLKDAYFDEARNFTLFPSALQPCAFFFSIL